MGKGCDPKSSRPFSGPFSAIPNAIVLIGSSLDITFALPFWAGLSRIEGQDTRDLGLGHGGRTAELGQFYRVETVTVGSRRDDKHFIISFDFPVELV